MNILRCFTLVAVALLGSVRLSAQSVDSLALSHQADTTIVATVADSLAQQKIDSAQLKRHVPVPPVRTLGAVAAIDTLPTTSEELQIVLFNDNTWRYVRTKPSKQQENIFKESWNTGVTHVYYGVTPESLPESVAIELVDSLGSCHYPYKGWISSKYGPRGGRGHQGVDLPLKTGDPVYATFDGKVRYSAFSSSGYGNLVIIRHNNGLETYYAHLSEREVVAGDWVVAGQQIGKGGSTGRSSGPHLHFEVRYKGQSFDPERLFDFKTGELRRADLLLKRRHYSINSRYEQDFGDEEAAEKQAAAKSTPQKSSSSSSSSSASKTPSTAQYHTIVDGDTLGHLAVKYKTTVKKICELNNIEETTILKLGRKLRVK
ncbi:MAG: peptidoglycan DD-metalloendopeptidase family protein [Alistipes sp.]|nr:peptidoglycan DD-metalloendopeptidase family protein [Alistipes sp.]